MIICDAVSVTVEVDGAAIADGLRSVAAQAGTPLDMPNLRSWIEMLIAENVKVRLSSTDDEDAE